MKTKRIVALAVASVMALGTLTACSGGKEDCAMKIGLLAPTTGAVSSYGQASLNGSLLAIEQANANKLFDKEVIYKSEDEQGKNDVAVQAYQRLVNVEKVDVIVGDITSGCTKDVAKEAVKDGIPMITPTGTAAPITIDRDNVFRACFLDQQQGEAMANFANKQGYKNVAILFNQDDEYSIGLKDAFKAKAKANGMTIVDEESYSAGDADYKAQLATINGKKPDAVYLPDYYNTVNTICQQKATYANLKDIPALGGDGWDGVLGIEGVNASVLNGAFFTNHYTMDDPRPVVQDFVKAYKAKYGKDPASFAALGYDAANIMMQAVKKAGSTDYKKVLEALKGMKYEGVTGTITFDKNGDPVKSITIVEIKDGKYTFNSTVG